MRRLKASLRLGRLHKAGKRHLVGWLLRADCFALVLCTGLRGGSATTTLSQCSERWGELMVQHCLTQDLLNQADRAVSYEDASSSDTELDRLRAGLRNADAKLSESRGLYARLYRDKTKPDVKWLSDSLDEIAASEKGSGALAQLVLQRLGDKLAGTSFRALPLAEDAIMPHWDPGTDIGTKYQPQRLLFGSTGEAGDDRLLPLRFDFGRSMFSFYAPMSSEHDLVLAQEQREHRSPAHQWMAQHNSGYHYWAGVYNNQNTYIAPWFLKAHGKEDDVWMKLANGKLLRSGSEWGQVNIWNPAVQQYVRTYCETQARLLGGDPYLVCYDFTAEPHPWGSQPSDPPGLPQFSGYNDSAITAFREWLRGKFGFIETLNNSWKSSYADFAAIDPPPDPYVKFPTCATPLMCEFIRFRCESNTRFWKMACDGYRKEDKHKPVVANASMYMSGWPLEGLDAWQMQKAGVADWIDMHMNSFPPNLPEQIYLYSLCRLTGKTPVQFEYIWTFPRESPFDDNRESDFQNTCKTSVWRNLVWGKRALVFFDAAYDWPTYHNGFLDSGLNYSILRPSICVFPAVKRRALRFSDILFNTEVTTPPIIVLQPSSSVWNTPPEHPHNAFSYHTDIAGDHIHPLLFSRNYPFLYVPEEAVLENGYRLSQHSVIILPAAPYLPTAMTERLLEWVQNGGTLICLGPAGMWDPYGHADGRLLDTTLGKTSVQDKRPGHWDWAWKIETPLESVRQIRNADGSLHAAIARYGKGRLLISRDDFDAPDLRSKFYEMLDAAIGSRPAACAENSLELVLREDQQGQQYLFALNPHIREMRKQAVVLNRQFRSCTDLGIGSGIRIPIQTTADQTSFTMMLQPGEGTVIKLEK